MKIIVLYPYFKDENSPGHSMMFKLVTMLLEKGHIITVITTNSSYMESDISNCNANSLLARSEIKKTLNLTVLSVNSKIKQHKSILNRLFFYIDYTFFVFKSLLSLKGNEIIFCSSPPIFHSIPAIFYSYLFKIPVLLEVRDLWPRSLIEMGLVKSKFNIRVLEFIEKITYGGSKRIVCYTEGIYRDISTKSVNNKLDLIRCGVDLTLLNSCDRLDKAIIESYGLTDKKVAIYFGAIGIANNIEFILSAAKILLNDKKIIILIIGDGVSKKAVVDQIKINKLDNVKVLPAVSKRDAAMYINIASVCLVTLLDRPVFQGAIPTKMIDYMACAKPIVSNVKGEAEILLDSSGAGVTTDPDDIHSFAAEIKRFCYDSVLAGQTGLLGRKFVENNFSIDSYLHKFENAIIKTVNQE